MSSHHVGGYKVCLFVRALQLSIAVGALKVQELACNSLPQNDRDDRSLIKHCATVYEGILLEEETEHERASGQVLLKIRPLPLLISTSGSVF